VTRPRRSGAGTWGRWLRRLPERQVAALRALRAIWSEDRFIVIGAAAVACHIGLAWRGTADLDLSVAAGPDAYAGDLQALGWRRERGAPQRWTTPAGGLVDVVPGAAALVRRGGFAWPEGGAEMSLVGFRLAFADAAPVVLAPRLRVRIASLRSVVVLKMAAYLDRPWERETDLEDLAHILSRFLADDAPERWSDEIVDRGLDFEDAGPFLLGAQIGGLADRAERGLIRRFLAALDDPGDRLSTLSRMARRSPAGWTDPDRLGLRWGAFRAGFERPGRRGRGSPTSPIRRGPGPDRP